MKNYIFLLLTFFGLSCGDILEEAPKSVVVENYYNTPQEVEAAIFDIYRQIKTNNGFGNLYPIQLEVYGDFAEGRGSYNPVSQFQGLDATNTNRVGQIW